MKPPSKITTSVLATAALATITGAGWGARAGAAPKAAPSAEAKVARGRHLVNTSACHDCHTPFKLTAKGAEPDMERMLSGHPEALVMPPVPALPQGPWQIVASGTNTAWAGPWGTSFTANLTPDKETGLGKWTARNFVETIRTGRHLGRGRPLLPPMPIPAYSQMPDEDLEAIFAYLQTIPAIKNKVPEPRPPVAPSGARASNP